MAVVVSTLAVPTVAVAIMGAMVAPDFGAAHTTALTMGDTMAVITTDITAVTTITGARSPLDGRFGAIRITTTVIRTLIIRTHIVTTGMATAIAESVMGRQATGIPAATTGIGAIITDTAVMPMPVPATGTSATMVVDTLRARGTTAIAAYVNHSAPGAVNAGVTWRSR